MDGAHQDGVVAGAMVLGSWVDTSVVSPGKRLVSNYCTGTPLCGGVWGRGDHNGIGGAGREATGAECSGNDGSRCGSSARLIRCGGGPRGCRWLDARRHEGVFGTAARAGRVTHAGRLFMIAQMTLQLEVAKSHPRPPVPHPNAGEVPHDAACTGGAGRSKAPGALREGSE